MVVFGLAVRGSALAGPVEVEGELVKAKFDASFSPERLSRKEQTPTVVRAEMRFEPPEFSRVPPLERFEIEIGRHARLNLKGVPVCRGGSRDAASLEKRCKNALVGRGTMETNVRFPESEAINLKTEVSIYRMELPNHTPSVDLVTTITIPVPRQVVIPIAVERSHGRFGLKLVGSVPKIAGGSGSITRLLVWFHKGVFSATCPDRHLDTRFSATFVDGTRLGGSVLRHCTPSP